MRRSLRQGLADRARLLVLAARSVAGRRFWILGLLPVHRDTILWSKFLFAASGSIVPCSSLILLSDVMLRVSPLVLASHQLTCVLLCVGLSGIAVGLGGRLPNFRESLPRDRHRSRSGSSPNASAPPSRSDWRKQGRWATTSSCYCAASFARSRG